MKLIGKIYHRLREDTKMWLALDPKTQKIVAASSKLDLAIERAHKKGLKVPQMVKGAKVSGFRI